MKPLQSSHTPRARRGRHALAAGLLVVARRSLLVGMVGGTAILDLHADMAGDSESVKPAVAQAQLTTQGQFTAQALPTAQPQPPTQAQPAPTATSTPMVAPVRRVQPIAVGPAQPAAAAVQPVSASPLGIAAAAPPPLPPKPVVAAKLLFGAAKKPAPMAARAIGYYSRGCLAGAQQLPVNGAEWQAMRLSRNRNWGTPELVSFLERFAQDARRFEGWPGLLVGDMSQPRGGPMTSGHASHQVGLDVDIWYTPMPDHRLTAREREDLSAVDLVAASKVEVEPDAWSPDYVRLLRRAASFGEVERIFVHPAIKKELCAATVHDVDRTWLSKMRPMWGHNDHFHVRIKCPEGMVGCKAQTPPAPDGGCGKELTQWLALVSRHTVASAAPSGKASPPAAAVTMDSMPGECRAVLAAPVK